MNNTLQIGIPVYNGARFITATLESLLQQTYTDWQLLISDNCSTDSTPQICQEYAAKDSRIQYVRQPQNIGVTNNFVYLMENSQAPYFMWLAADDTIENTFLAHCMAGLLHDESVGFSFSNIVNTDALGRTTRTYPSFMPFTTPHKECQLINYLLSPEVMGKANLFYSIYRLSACKEFILQFLKQEQLINCDDVVMVFGLLCRTNLYIAEEPLFKKRIPEDTTDVVQPIVVQAPYVIGWISNENRLIFLEHLRQVAQGTPYMALIDTVLTYRQHLVTDIVSYIQRTHNEKDALLQHKDAEIAEIYTSKTYTLGKLLRTPYTTIKKLLNI